MDDIKFKNGRHEVRLPIKEGHPVLEDQYLSSLKRLHKLKNRLSNHPEILREYNKIIEEQVRDGVCEIVDNLNRIL